MLIRERMAEFVNPVFRSRGLIWLPDGGIVRRHRNVLAVLGTPRGPLLAAGSNLVTNEGDLYYAQRGAAETPTTDFTAGGLRLGSASTTPTKSSADVTTFIASTGKAVSGSYPTTNDGDADNTGAGTDIVSWLFSYTKGDFNAPTIAEGAIVDNTGTPTKALAHFLFDSSFAKTANDTLKVFVNHEMLGA